ncbi:DUF192 domain-containing protein [Falsirhodobacter sp. 20TX0035]|uniref:DUF192 domain-containing protein n=1 Tax=Falsirhodobacter sp. 20TX0035 TaxID=3022019 RepID=UPI002330D072|nr:DUF192 domain-containing protein [Falsirhodobacter sp. 20TX0035]MDB6454449.1 DUF192 domain-containing protein [Falsirhodobacter sp. 20TX0035]
MKWLLALCLMAAPAGAMAACRADQVEFRNAGGVARFSVEVADDAAERAQGLMNREHMAASAGMLFVYERPQPASFWMRNTLIPLDMIFMDQTGTVRHVHANARPKDDTPIDGGNDVLVVLEINGGLAGRLGIGEGSVMRSPYLNADLAAWPCE